MLLVGGAGTAHDPTAPYQLTASLDTLGNVIVKWKTSQPPPPTSSAA
jgi:hypothetical protein